MPHIGWKVGGRVVPVAEALEIARREGHFDRFPAPALRAMTRTRESGWSLSPSSATGCQRQRLLKIYEPYVLVPEDEATPLMGTGLHKALETDDEHDEMMLEVPLTVETVAGTEVTLPLRGRTDHYDPEYRRVIDFKKIGWFTRKGRDGKMQVNPIPKDDHIVQVNLYRWLLEENGYPVEHAAIWYVNPIPKTPRKFVEVVLWPVEEVRALAHELSYVLADALATGVLPPPVWDDPERKWQCNYCPVAEPCKRRHSEGGEAELIPPEVMAYRRDLEEVSADVDDSD